MANTITVKPNQSMSDVIIQATGSLAADMCFCKDNNVSVTDIPVVGTQYIVSDAALAMGDGSVLEYLARNSIVIGTLGNSSLTGYITEDASELYIGEDGETYVEE